LREVLPHIFSTTTQATINSPQLPINPPQIHHKKNPKKNSNPNKIATSTMVNV
jgi:hypothetical protein